MRKVLLLVSVFLLFFGTLGFSQEPTPPPEQKSPQAEKAEKPEAKEPAGEPKPYEKVITKDAQTKQGIFTVHQLKEKYYYEIPKAELNKEFLWVSRLSRANAGVDRGGGAFIPRVVRWEVNKNKVYLREVRYDMVADPKTSIAKGVAESNSLPILMAFNVEAWGKDGAPVIDVTRLFTTEVNELSVKAFLRGSGALDAARSYIERVVPFPTNIEVEATNTYSGGAGAPSASGQPAAPQASITVGAHYSMIKLPEKPMMPRLFDDRVGFFSVRQTDYGTEEHRAAQRTYISRWRLEKKDPNAAVSEPVKQIVYYVDPATPKKWVPYIKRAIEAWQGALEGAGFKNAIIAKDVPSPEEDSNWSPEDVRHSVISWLPSTTENAMGPSITDPRSGEILNAPVSVYHNIMNLQTKWYFTQVGPLDPRAKKLPLPDDLMGDLIEYVVAHEVGHTLGLQHNFVASSTYPIEKIRDREWLKKMGHVPSIMDYSRFNYVAQPEDKIDVKDLIPGVGPYDRFAIMWGYTPIPAAMTPDNEKAKLDEWARRQDKEPWLRFLSDAGRYDPGSEAEAVGDADAVKATALGMKNLERVSNMLLAATTTEKEKGEPYDHLQEMYNNIWGQWSMEMGHVVRIVGGIYGEQKHIGQEGVLYSYVPAARQKAAVKFLNENAFVTPQFMIKPEILGRIQASGTISRVTGAQKGILRSLLAADKITRLQEQQTFNPKDFYSPTELLADVRKGVWKELDGTGPVKIDPYRRDLQRGYIDVLNSQINRVAVAQAPANPGAPAPTPSTEDVRALFRADLRSLSAAVTAAISRTGDSVTKAHLEDIKDQIAKSLDPKFAPPSPAPAAAPRGITPDGMEQWWQPRTCWPEYPIEK